MNYTTQLSATWCSESYFAFLDLFSPFHTADDDGFCCRLSKQAIHEIGLAFSDTINYEEGSLPLVYYKDVVDMLVVASPKTANLKEKTGLSCSEERILRVSGR